MAAARACERIMKKSGVVARHSTILLVILSVLALALLASVFGYLIRQRNIRRQRQRNRSRLKFYRNQKWDE